MINKTGNEIFPISQYLGLQCIECSGTSSLDNCYRDATSQSSYTIRRVTCNPQNNNQGNVMYLE